MSNTVFLNPEDSGDFLLQVRSSVGDYLIRSYTNSMTTDPSDLIDMIGAYLRKQGANDCLYTAEEYAELVAEDGDQIASEQSVSVNGGEYYIALTEMTVTSTMLTTRGWLPYYVKDLNSPVVLKCDYLEIVGEHDTLILHAEDGFDVFDTFPENEVFTVERKHGWIAGITTGRRSDRIEYAAFDTEDEACQHLIDMYVKQ